MRILVTGCHGQLVQSLQMRMPATGEDEIVAVGRPDIDLASPGNLTERFSRLSPDAVVNAAAYTAVDRAESEEALAFAINRGGAEAVAQACSDLNVPLIHISTDYVFSGDKPEAYVESDATGPMGAYGRSKLAGEMVVAQAQPRSLIFRTAWVYSPFGANFVKTMLKLARTKSEVRVVGDQTGNPTSAIDLADAVILAARRMKVDSGLSGTFHVAGSGEATWCDFAKHVFAVSREMGGPHAEVVPITTAEYPTAARRPQNSRLDCAKFGRIFGGFLPDWRGSSRTCVSHLLQSGAV